MRQIATAAAGKHRQMATAAGVNHRQMATCFPNDGSGTVRRLSSDRNSGRFSSETQRRFYSRSLAVARDSRLVQYVTVLPWWSA